MKRLPFPVAAAVLLLSGASAAVPALAETPAMQRSDPNTDDQIDLSRRMDDLDQRIATAQADRSITRTRASQLKRRLAATRKSYTKLVANQGFLNAAASATFNANLDAIEDQLPR